MSETKLTTKEKLINSAIDLFSEKWYETVSIAEICRYAQLSNGVYYRYYKNKESIFREILDYYLVILNKKFDEIKGETLEERLKSFIRVFSQLTMEFRKVLLVYKEGQFRFNEYEGLIREQYMLGLEKILQRKATEAEYLFISCTMRFLSFRDLFINTEDMNELIDEISDMILNGIFKSEVSNIEEVFKIDDIKYPDELSDDTTKNKILLAGINQFGISGYHNVNVYDIVKEAGFSVGSFYIYFDSKEKLISEIITYLGKRIRHFLSQNINKKLNRLEQELQGIYLFLYYFYDRRNYYQILRESEFVVNEKAIEYYNKFEKGYKKSLRDIGNKDSVLVGNFLMGISHFMGIEMLYTKTIEDKQKLIEEIGKLLSKGIS